MTDKVQLDPAQYEAAKMTFAPEVLEGFEAKPVEVSPITPADEQKPDTPVEPEPVTEQDPPAEETPTPPEGAEFEELEQLEGIDRRKYGETVKYGHIEDGTERWLTLQEMRDGTQSMSVAQKRFREVAEEKKKLDDERKTFTEERDSFNQLQSDSAAISNVLGPLLGNEDDPEDTESSELSKKVDSLAETIAKKDKTEQDAKDAVAAQQVLDAGVNNAFDTVGKFLVDGNFEIPDGAAKPEEVVATAILTACGGLVNENYYKQASDPKVVFQVFKEKFGLKPKTAAEVPPVGDTPPSTPIDTSVKSKTVGSKMDTLVKEKKALLEKLNSGNLSPDEIGKYGGRCQIINTEIAKIKQKGG